MKNSTQNDQHGAKREPKCAKEPPKTPSGEQGRTNYENKCWRLTKFGSFVDQNSSESDPKKNLKKRLWGNIEFDAKGVPTWSKNRCQNHSSINAKIGNGRIITIIRNHVFLYGKTMAFEGLAGCVRGKRYQQKHQTRFQHPSQNR